MDPLLLDHGWWRSGDFAELGAEGWLLLGRLDGAIQSGGETVFPEQVEQRLLTLAQEHGLPGFELLLLAEPDPLWGERLVALVKTSGSDDEPESALCELLQALSYTMPPSQRPRRWIHCSELERNKLGKWDRKRWSQWLRLRP